jgi:hypothetical protein
MPTNVHWFRHWSLKEADGQNLTAMSTESKYANNCKSTKDSTTNTSWDWLHLEFVHWIFHHSSMPQSKWKTMFLFAKSVGVGELKWQSFASIRLCPWLHQIGSVVINWSVPHPAAKYTLYKKKRRNVSKQRTLLHSLKRLTLVMLEKTTARFHRPHKDLQNFENWVRWQNLPNFIKTSLHVAANSPTYIGIHCT